MKETEIKGVASIFTERIQQGIAQIIPCTFRGDPEADIEHGEIFRMYEGQYVMLFVKNQIMMSDSNMELITNKEFIQNARGNVLIAGLGLGMILNNILDKPEVLSVTVIEKYKDVIDLVAPKYVNPKLTIHNANVFHWNPEHDQFFDSIYFDIWPEIIVENLFDMQVLEDRFREHLSQGGNMDCWMKKHLHDLLISDTLKQSYPKNTKPRFK